MADCEAILNPTFDIQRQSAIVNWCMIINEFARYEIQNDIKIKLIKGLDKEEYIISLKIFLQHW